MAENKIDFEDNIATQNIPASNKTEKKSDDKLPEIDPVIAEKIKQANKIIEKLKAANSSVHVTVNPDGTILVTDKNGKTRNFLTEDDFKPDYVNEMFEEFLRLFMQLFKENVFLNGKADMIYKADKNGLAVVFYSIARNKPENIGLDKVDHQKLMNMIQEIYTSKGYGNSQDLNEQLGLIEEILGENDKSTLSRLFNSPPNMFGKIISDYGKKTSHKISEIAQGVEKKAEE